MINQGPYIERYRVLGYTGPDSVMVRGSASEAGGCGFDTRPRHTKKVQVGKDQEKAQSEKDSHSKNRGGKKPN